MVKRVLRKKYCKIYAFKGLTILHCYKKHIIHFGSQKLFLKTSNKSYQSDDIVLLYNKLVKI